jgi:hypothetical protein
LPTVSRTIAREGITICGGYMVLHIVPTNKMGYYLTVHGSNVIALLLAQNEPKNYLKLPSGYI